MVKVADDLPRGLGRFGEINEFQVFLGNDAFVGQKLKIDRGLQ